MPAHATFNNMAAVTAAQSGSALQHDSNLCQAYNLVHMSIIST